MKFNKDKFEKKLYKELKFYTDNGKDQSINFLIWYLVNFFRIDEGLAYDLVCDHKNDKGIDGIYVDDDSKEIILFQSKLREKFNKGEGDGDLRKLFGSLEWFKLENIGKLDDSRASKELKDLVKELDVFQKLTNGYALKGYFLTTGFFDNSAKDYIKITNQKIEYWDNQRLFDNYTFSSNDDLVKDVFTFRTSNDVNKIDYSKTFKAYIIIPTASELLNLKGIVDQSLFAKNVRYGLGGKTNVNKSITKTIKDQTKHSSFSLFHNGITIIAEKAENQNNEVKITNYSIVNGCQSTLTLYENREYITQKLRIPIKIVETGENTKLSEEITYFANNQNPIKTSDLKSREKFQLDLKNQFSKYYGSKYQYKIKKGETINPDLETIENTFAAQLIHSFINESPWNAHLKSSIFANNYDQIFTRHIDVHLIFFLREIFTVIENNLNLISIPVVRSYQPTKFFVLFTIKKILADDSLGKLAIKNTKEFLSKNSKYIDSFEKLIKTILIQFDSNLKMKANKHDGHIEYKNLLRNTTEVNQLATDVITGYKVLEVHQPDITLSKMLQKK
jgi:hypothetical protein